MNYYNEFDPAAAAWLRQLITDGLLPNGVVDERSITDVQPDDLVDYTQCHFFAGIGGWDYALQLAGWPADRQVWTGSCPCQPFSAAGKGLGTDDERHLWPQFLRLIAECRPAAVFGEQVASKAGRSWLAGVRTDLEALGYGVGAADLCAAGVGAPHIRQRLYWLADAAGSGHQQRELGDQAEAQRPALGGGQESGQGGWGDDPAHGRCPDGGLADAEHDGPHTTQHGHAGRSGADSWTDFDWTPCADGKARRIKPGLKPLVDGLPRGMVPSVDPGAPGYAEETAEARVMRLRGYGNAIVPQLAAEFIGAYMEATA